MEGVKNIISNKHYQLVYSFVMAFFMSAIMSLVITIFNLGLTDNLLQIWLKAWSFGFIIAFPTVLLVSRFVTKIVSYVIINESDVVDK
jgi:TctA family transporter